MTAFSQPVRAILFDLDGTLVDSSRDIAASTNAALEQLGAGPFTVEEIMPHVGRGAYHLLAWLSGRHQRGDARVEAAVRTFIDHYRQMGAVTSRLYPGMSRVLQGLEGQLRMAVISNKPEALVWATLDHLRIDKYFDIVLGGDTLPRKKPDPMPIDWTLKRLRIDPTDAVIIGDTATDIEAGYRAGVWTGGVTWGFGDPSAHPERAPHTLIDAPPVVVQRFPPATS